MPRNMSFAMTTSQVQNKTKTVTRRYGWNFLKPGDVVRAVNKTMGLKKGEKIRPICLIKIISNTREPLNAITKDDVVKEGFPNWEPSDFIDMLVSHYKVDPSDLVNRIEFEYL